MKNGFLKHGVALLVMVATLAFQDAASQTAEEVLRLLRGKYETMEAMKASFSQTTTSSFMDTPARFYGEILLADKRYRIETASQTIVTDGVVTWVHNRTENQVLINDYIEDEMTFSLSTFLAEFDTAYRVEKYEQTGMAPDRIRILKLIPSDPFSAFQSVTIHARESDNLVTRLDVLDLNDVEMRFDLTDIEFNPEVPQAAFTFTVPSGVEVVDLREG